LAKWKALPGSSLLFHSCGYLGDDGHASCYDPLSCYHDAFLESKVMPPIASLSEIPGHDNTKPSAIGRRGGRAADQGRWEKNRWVKEKQLGKEEGVKGTINR
jgi:hypothetical protein